MNFQAKEILVVRSTKLDLESQHIKVNLDVVTCACNSRAKDEDGRVLAVG